MKWQGECKKLALVSNVATVIEPPAPLEYLRCPPHLHPDEFWCK